MVFLQTTSPNTSADLSVTKSSLSDPIIAGDSLTYSVNVSNAGPSDAVNVVITEIYEENFLFSSSSPSPDSGTTNRWTFKTVGAGETETISITGSVDPSAVGSLSNSTTITYDMDDPDSDNNSTDLSNSILNRLAG